MNQLALRRGRSILVGSAALFWAGLLTGVSLLATPIKFTAPSLQLPVALEVGHVTFAALNKVEIAAALLLVLFVAGFGRSLWNLLGALLLVVLVALQTFWLLPVLDARVAIIVAGGTPPESSLHLLYVLVEAAKLAGLFGLAAYNLRR